MRTGRPLGTLLPVVILALLLGGLAVLQYKWLGELAEADLTRTRASARDRAAQLASAFDREITRAFAKLGLPAATADGRQSFAAAWQEWRNTAQWPDLVSRVYAIEPGTGSLERYDVATGAFVPSEWPPELSAVRERLQRAVQEGRAEERVSLREADAAASAIPALLVATPPGAEPRTPGLIAPGSRMPGGLALVALDRSVMANQVFPALEARFFDPRDDFDYVARVTDGREPAQRYYETAGGLPGWRAEVSTGIFDVRFDHENRDLDPRRGSGDARRGSPSGRSGRGRREAGRWTLEVANRLQPLEAMVAANRRRNLLVSFGVLGLLGASVFVLAASARRAQVLALQQMEFVAGVSHELQSPLAVMSSAAENLADGVVREPEQVRRYGATLHAEARRLSTLVDQVLGYVGTYSGAVQLEQEPVDVKSLVHDTLGALATPLRDAGMSVEVAVPPEIPPLQGNGAALRRCLANLVQNAIKYRGSSSALVIAAFEEAARGGRRIALSVSDRGVGFAPEEASRLFEPFFRGRAAMAAQAPGTGLGLAVVRRTVEALGGTVEAAPRGGGGSVFTLRLPAAERVTA